jgi:hypothetical protein
MKIFECDSNTTPKRNVRTTMHPHEAKSCDLIKRVCLTIRDCNLKSHPNKFLVIFGARPRPRIIAHGARPSSEYFHLRRPNVFVNYSRFVLSREQFGVGTAPVASPLELYTEVLYHVASSRVQDTTRRVAVITVLCLSRYRRASVFFS